MFMIRNKASGEVTALVADASHRHPGWVHEQCGTRTEGELQALLGRLQLADYIRAGKNNEDARGVFVSIPNGAVAWKLADPFQSARWLFDESEVVEAVDLDPSLVVMVGGVTPE